MPADFSQPVPVHNEKVDALHVQTELPARPRLGRRDLVAVYLPVALGLLFSIGAVALAFQARASWESHRDWVVPVTIPLLVIGGLAMGFLAARVRLMALGPAIGFVALALLFVVLNILRGEWTEGEDGLRDVMSIITGVLLALAVVSVVAAFVYDEVKNPVRPPAPEA